MQLVSICAARAQFAWNNLLSLSHSLFLLPILITLILAMADKPVSWFADHPFLNPQFSSIRQALCMRKMPSCLVDGTLEIGHLSDIYLYILYITYVTCLHESIQSRSVGRYIERAARWDNSDFEVCTGLAPCNVSCNIKHAIPARIPLYKTATIALADSAVHNRVLKI